MIDYSKLEVPGNYKCGNCEAVGIKLWREYQTISPKLLCLKCVCLISKVEIESVNLSLCDSIGWYVPAVPDRENIGYWGYISVPDEAVKWWLKLPTK